MARAAAALYERAGVTIRRVALLSPYALDVFGGVQEQVLSMSRELVGRSIEVLVVAPGRSDSRRYDTEATVRRFGSSWSLPANGSRAPVTLSPGAARAARHAITEFSPDVVHFHEPFAPLLGYDALRAHELPAVGTFHRAGSGPAFSLTRPLLRRLAKGLDSVAAVSQAAATTISAEVQITAPVLFNGFETQRFREFSHVANEVPVIFFIGRLEARKGVMTLVRAAQQHRLDGAPSWRVVIAGDGPLRDQISEINGRDSAVELLGAIDDATKRRWLAEADVVVAPSTHGESFGLVVLEAMSSGTRVVAADIDGYREAAAGHAVLFAAGDITSLVNAIDFGLRSRDSSTLESARRHAEGWSMAHLVDRYLDIYEDAIRCFQRNR